MDELGREIRQATRRLLRAPAFSLAAALTIALAIGANAAIFTVVHRIVLNPLPYPESNRLLDLNHAATAANADTVAMTLGLYHHYEDRARTLDGVAIYLRGEQTLTSDGEPERIQLARATTSLASVLQVQPVLGRWFVEDEGIPNGPGAAVLSFRIWQRRYGGDSAILGRSIALDGVPTPIVGVMPAGFAFPDPSVDVWVPLQTTRAQLVFDDFSYTGVARLRDGATVDDARRELTGLIAALPTLYPENPATSGLVDRAKLVATPRTLKEATIFGVTRGLYILLASMGLVLLIACANVANLFLVRSETRQRELAVRRALGAGRGALARLFFAESLLLSAAGGLAGLGLAWIAVRFVVTLGPATLPRLDEVRLDGIVLAFTCGLTLVAGLAFGATPLLRRQKLAASLHEGGRGNTGGRAGHRTRHALMAGQVALALVLLVSSGLMLRSFQNLRAVDPGFNPASTLTFQLGLPEREYPSRTAAIAAHRAILDRISALPGVTSASASTRLPLLEGLGFGSLMRVQGQAAAEGALPPIVGFRAIAGSYFETLGMAIRRGRGIDRGDIERNEPIAVVNEALVQAYFPDRDPIGALVARGSADVNAPWLTVVGVVSNTPLRLAEANPVPQLYLPMSVSGPSGVPGLATAGPGIAQMSYVVRSATPPLGLLPAVRRAIDAIDPNLALAEVGTLQGLFDRSSAQMAFTMALLVIAASVALMLGLVGIYGVILYVVSQRTSEIGVRLAFGAEPRRVAGMIVRQGGLVTLSGLVIGLGIALAGSRLIESLLYGVSPRDPAVFAVTTIGLLGVAALACWVPARRAARVDPVEALRSE